jgi:gas vesicle protein
VRQEKIPNFVWFLAGLGIGAVAGVVLAPQPGADTRQLLSRRAREATDYVTTHGHDYLDYGRDLYDKGRQLADEAAELFEEGRRLVEEAGEPSGTNA